MAYETLDFKRDGVLGILTINRPQALNALNSKVVSELGSLFVDLKSDKELRAIIVTGSGEKAFVAGADIKEMDAIDASKAQKFAEEGQRAFDLIETLQIPTIAAVNGFALGGGLELALACDVIIASKTAKLGLPEVSLGLIPGFGGTQRLSRNVGKSIAKLMTLTGDLYTAEQCEKWGLVAMTTEPADLLATCTKIAKKMSERSPVAIGLAKDAIRRGFDTNQPEGMQIEAKGFHAAFNSEDRKEGTKAFIEKRAPLFK